MIFRRARENRQNIMRLLSPAQNYLKGMGDLKILKTPKMENPDPRRPSVEKLKSVRGFTIAIYNLTAILQLEVSFFHQNSVLQTGIFKDF